MTAEREPRSQNKLAQIAVLGEFADACAYHRAIDGHGFARPVGGRKADVFEKLFQHDVKLARGGFVSPTGLRRELFGMRTAGQRCSELVACAIGISRARIEAGERFVQPIVGWIVGVDKL